MLEPKRFYIEQLVKKHLSIDVIQEASEIGRRAAALSSSKKDFTVILELADTSTSF